MNKVSIIIRTCNRPSLLKRALESVAKQSILSDVEVVVVEDGPPKSEFVLHSFAHLNIKYYATSKSVGRTKDTNFGLEISEGKYINFLDDDDLFFPNHIESMLNGFKECEEAVAVHTAAIERKIKYLSMTPLRIKIIREFIKHNQPLRKDALFHKNMFPIQAVMFKRELYEKYGGMDERFELLEDWDLWIKYSLKGLFYYVDIVTSAYHIPADIIDEQKREKELLEQEIVLRNKYKPYFDQSDYKEDNVFVKISRFYKANGMKKTIKKGFEFIRNKL